MSFFNFLCAASFDLAFAALRRQSRDSIDVNNYHIHKHVNSTIRNEFSSMSNFLRKQKSEQMTMLKREIGRKNLSLGESQLDLGENCGREVGL